jgi:hypothetical protein
MKGHWVMSGRLPLRSLSFKLNSRNWVRYYWRKYPSHSNEKPAAGKKLEETNMTSPSLYSGVQLPESDRSKLVFFDHGSTAAMFELATPCCVEARCLQELLVMTHSP